MKIDNVAELRESDKFCSCVECGKHFEDDRCMKRILFEHELGFNVVTHTVYLCSKCYEKLFQAMCENDIDESMLANDTEMKQIFDQKE